jgi:hypothetical protein
MNKQYESLTRHAAWDVTLPLKLVFLTATARHDSWLLT